MVRAERGGRLYDLFKERSVVAVGWSEIGDLSTLSSRDKIASAVAECWPDWKPQAIAMAAGQIHRFRSDLKTGDVVLTYDPGRRLYLVGEIAGDYRFDPTVDPDDPNVRPVHWRGEVSRDLLTASSRSSLGSISTLFALGKEVLDDVERALTSKQPPTISPQAETVTVEEDVFRDIQANALEFIKDRISALSWSDMQELVAGLLRALGYKTRVSPMGPDQGKDIIASPDGFGFEPPRIVVEVKHRQGAMGAQAIRSFLGGRHPQDKGLYVSTGGFTKEARYEADRANIPLSLMTGDELVTAIIEQYEKLDLKTQQLVPLKKIYWPA